MLVALKLIACILAPVGFLLAIALTVFWIWMLIEVVTKEPSEGNTQLIWVLVILFTHALGACLYFLFRRGDRIREVGG